MGDSVLMDKRNLRCLTGHIFQSQILKQYASRYLSPGTTESAAMEQACKDEA